MTERAACILIVEDEESLRRSLRVFLEDEGFDVLTAASGEDGLRFLADYTPDAAIVDVRLPGMDGDLFIEKARELNREIRFIIYTGSVSYKPSSRLAAAGIRTEQVFRKPLPELSVLVDSLKGLLAEGAHNG